MCKSRVRAALAPAIVLGLISVGCVIRVPSDLANLAASIDSLVGEIQDDDPRDVDLFGDDDES